MPVLLSVPSIVELPGTGNGILSAGFDPRSGADDGILPPGAVTVTVVVTCDPVTVTVAGGATAGQPPIGTPPAPAEPVLPAAPDPCPVLPEDAPNDPLPDESEPLPVPLEVLLLPALIEPWSPPLAAVLPVPLLVLSLPDPLAPVPAMLVGVLPEPVAVL